MHTSDLRFFDNDDYFHFTSCAKELIIRNGENYEIASAISAHETIAEVKIISVPDEFYC